MEIVTVNTCKDCGLKTVTTTDYLVLKGTNKHKEIEIGLEAFVLGLSGLGIKYKIERIEASCQLNCDADSD